MEAFFLYLKTDGFDFGIFLILCKFCMLETFAVAKF